MRRQEELIWLAGNGFTRVLSLLDSPHNLHAYDEAGIAYEHVPLGRHDELADAACAAIYATLAGWLDDPEERVLIHHEEFGDRLLGVLAGYLIYAGLVSSRAARTRSSRSSRSPGASSVPRAARSSRSPSTRASSAA